MLIIEEIKKIELTPKKLGQFGLLLSILLILISAYLFFRSQSSAWIYLLILSLGLIILTIFFRKGVAVLYKPWMAMGIIIGQLITIIILGIIFYLVITPLSIVMRLTGKIFMEQKIDHQKESYWHDKDKTYQMTKEHYERQY